MARTVADSRGSSSVRPSLKTLTMALSLSTLAGVGSMSAGSALAEPLPPVVPMSECGGSTELPPPPSGFNAAIASTSALQAAGLPAPPLGGVNSPSVVAYDRALAHAQNYTESTPTCVDATNANYSGNYSGHIVNDGLDYTYASTTWKQPSIPSSGDGNTEAYWAGVGVTSILQAGTDAYAENPAVYRFFTEDFPEKTDFEGPAVSPGDVLYVNISYDGGNYTSYWLENETTDDFQVFRNPSPDVGFRAADFIDERLGGTGLANFGTFQTSANSYGNSTDGFTLSASDNSLYIMSSDCFSDGTILASPSSVSNGGFTETWGHSSPYVDKCP